MRRILDSIRSLSRRAPEAEEQAASRFVVSIPARLLVGIAGGGAARSALTRPKLIGSILNISASGLAVQIPSLDIRSQLIGGDAALKIMLDLHPLGTIEMDGLAVRVERVDEAGRPGYILGVGITGMTHGDRALYLQYLGTKGWERVSAEGGD